MPSFLTTKVLAYVSGGLLIAVVALSVMLKLADAKAQHNYNQWQLAVTRLAVSNASIERLQLAVEADNAEDQARADALAQTREDARQDRLRWEGEREALETRLERLRRLPDREDLCEVDGEVTDALDGI